MTVSLQQLQSSYTQPLRTEQRHFPLRMAGRSWCDFSVVLPQVPLQLSTAETAAERRGTQWKKPHTHTPHTIILGILDNLFISPRYSHWGLIRGRLPLFERYSLTDTSITTGLFSVCSRRLVSIVTSENSNTGGPQNNGAKTSRRRSKQRNINKEHQLLLRALD